MMPPHDAIRDIVRLALTEDLVLGDATCEALFSHRQPAEAHVLAREDMVIVGILVAEEVCHQVDPDLKVSPTAQDGQAIREGSTVLKLRGDARSLLMAERVALNFMQRLSGIATLTQRFCRAVQGYPTRILDTRKTTPGLRLLEKWAVRLGGGTNHRFSLGDGILIKDNHLALLKSRGISVSEACRRARAGARHGLRIMVEAQTLDDVKQAVKGEPDVILLDNMPPPLVRQAVQLVKGRSLIEVSGGITLNNVREMAHAGADYISIGALTHSAPAVDLSMDVRPLDRERRRSS